MLADKMDDPGDDAQQDGGQSAQNILHGSLAKWHKMELNTMAMNNIIVIHIKLYLRHPIDNSKGLYLHHFKQLFLLIDVFSISFR